MHVKMRVFAGFLAIFALLASAAASAEKTDVVILNNGDRLTGEIVALRRGLLEFSTDTMGTVQIEWEEIARVESRALYEVDLESGARHFGSLQATAEPDRLAVRDAEGQVASLPVPETIRITPLDTTGSVKNLLDGYVDFGFSYSDATSVNQLSMAAGVSRRDFHRLSSLDFSLVESDAPETESAATSSLTTEIRNFLGNRTFWSGFGRLEQNDSLGLDLRTLVGAGYGKYMIQSNRREFAAMIGLAGTRENFDDGQTQESLEGFLGAQYNSFRFHSPEWSLSAGVAVFPSLTISGRIRTATTLRLRYEIFTDLYAQLALSHAYDSKPQSEGAEKTDYTLTSSLGYKF
jgi:putative salt-induced outer membrane protein YdiY